MGNEAELLPGTLDLLILKAVSLGPLHGYGVLLAHRANLRARITDRAGSALSGLVPFGAPGPPKGKLGKSDNNRRAKFYELTSSGRKRLREETDGWNRLVAAIAFCTGGTTTGNMSPSRTGVYDTSDVPDK
jgi:hypothetical protein